ncbi:MULTISPECIES: methyl-accepting chemotaxis protein [Shewanella]|uniref:Methyl-accepting chemotaxis protein n=2 Tax=Shewanella TaxID=22 RepID=A0ABT5TGV6_9GAMM|nr:methyl-accepting chemotaxis protein [Shewanella metallivivens]MDD8057846.1 methyl-accepting chemotaxis protein [Shewanella metallivivens]
MMLDLSIKRMLQITSALALSAMIILSWVGNTQQSRIHKRVVNEEAQVGAILALKDTRYYVVQIQQFLTDVGATKSDEAKAEALDSLNGALSQLDKLIDTAPEFYQQTKEIKGKVNDMYKSGLNMADAYLIQGTEAGNHLMKGSGGFDEVSSDLADDLDQLANQIDQQYTTAVKQTLSANVSAARVQFWGNLALGVFLAMILFVLYRAIINPLRKLDESMRNVASGAKDLTVKLDDSGNTEIATVATSFNAFVQQIHDLITDFNDNSQQLGTASVQLTTSSNETLAGMQRLQSETEQVATAMNQMQATVIEVANNAELAAQAAKDSDTQAVQGDKVVQLTITSIEQLANGVEQAASALHQLEKDTDNIGSILEVIRSISDQTNLLALNAAIEAARAGEHGRGFAVVADEVRTLSKRTQDSTNQIQQMISQLQAGVKDAVSVMDSSRQQALNSTEQAALAGEALSSITHSVATIANMATQIATAAEEQTAVTDEINRNIVNISDEAGLTATNAQQSYQASVQVDELSQQLRRQIGQFKTH